MVFGEASTFGGPGMQTSSNESSPVVRWRATGHGWYSASLSDGQGMLLGPDRVPAGSAADVQTALEAQAQVAGVPVAPGRWELPHRAVGWSFAASVLMILVPLAGPQPRLATKWTWFWLMLVPGGVTQLLWLMAEAPWSARASAIAEPRPHKSQLNDQRLTGGTGVCIAIVLTIILSTAGDALAPILSDWFGR